MHYAYAGEGSPILFLHGFPAFWFVWEQQLQQFGETNLVIAPDGRGVNLTSKPSEVSSYQIEYLAKDVIELADHLNLDSFVVIGHDWGGALAWEVAKRYPERVSHLIVANSPPYDALMVAFATIEEQRAASEYMTRLKAPTAESRFLDNHCEVLWQVAFGPLVAKGIVHEDARAMYQACWEQPGSMTGFLNWYRANMPEFDEIQADHFKPSEATQITTPTLLLWGEHERAFTRPLLNIIPEYAPNMQLEMISDANHWLFLEQPEIAYQHIMKFINP